MKIRTTFVSNSSSSSFICDFCGRIESGRDLNQYDAGMYCCENGHMFCEDDTNFDLDNLTEENYKDIKTMLQKRVEEYKENCDWEEEFIAKIDEYLESDDEEKDAEMKYYIYEIEADYYLREEIGIPEKYCPVCKRKKEMEKDEDYEQYKNLYDKFNGILPDGRNA